MPVPLNFPLQFEFRHIHYSCVAFVEQSEWPVLIFFVLKDKELIEQFGDEIIIKTDFHTSLPKKEDFPELVELKQNLWFALKRHPQFYQLVRLNSEKE